MIEARAPRYAVPLAITLATLAVVLATLAFFARTEIAPAAPATGRDADGPQLAAAIARLEARLTELERRPAPASVESAAPSLAREERIPVSDARVDELVARLLAVETRLASLARQVDGAPRPEDARQSEPQVAEVAPSRAELVTTSRAAILDARASDAAKVEAWGRLRSAGPDAWTDAVVDEMTRIGLTSPSADLRADVWRQADANARSERLVPALLQALSADAEHRVREEAAETLENYAELPHVRQALETAANADADEGVRRYARRSLERGSRTDR